MRQALSFTPPTLRDENKSAVNKYDTSHYRKGAKVVPEPRNRAVMTHGGVKL